ncbi:MAG: SUMF1/EgtB/PvdO family nonheme iron enzyme [Microcystaceae cyanobacterium]
MVALPQTRTTIPPTRQSSKDDTTLSVGKLPEIIILVSAPLLGEDKITPVESLSVQKEIDNVLSSLERLNLALKVRVRFATVETLMEVITQQEKPLILHYIGHGMPIDGEIALILEDELGLARPFKVSELHSILQNRPHSPCELALLNGCHSEGMANALTENGVNSVVAVNTEDIILDKTASCFAQQFYRSLFNLNTVQNSFIDACNAVEHNDLLKLEYSQKTLKKGVGFEEALKYHLIPRQSSHHHTISESLHQGDLIRPVWQDTNITMEDASFFGRNLEIYQVNCYLEQFNCVALHGMGGMGKTALAQAVGRWQHERERWRDGVWLVEWRNVATVGQARMRLGSLFVPERDIFSNEFFRQYFSDQRMLLILDDLDELIRNETERGELIRLLNALLSCRGVKLLLTSRDDIPTEIDHQRYEIKEMAKTDAIRAFYHYAPANKSWQRGEENNVVFETIMAFLDGYPFPIRLAGNYLKENRFSNLGDLSQRFQRLGASLAPLRPRTRQENRDNSLKATLEISYQALPVDVQDIFTFLALFPDGLTEKLMLDVLDDYSQEALITLLQYSMAEFKINNNEQKITLPEPARSYAKEKQKIDWLSRFGNKIIEYYHNLLSSFQGEIKQQLKAEQSNLRQFLLWGYEKERRRDQISYTARITLSLADHWQYMMPDEDVIPYLQQGVTVAKRNKDRLTEAKLYQTIGDMQLEKDGLGVARESYEQAITIYQTLLDKSNDDLEKARIYEEIGNIYFKYDQLETAEVNYLSARELYQAEDEQEEVKRVERLLGKLFFWKDPVIVQYSSPKVNSKGKIIETTEHSAKQYIEYLPNEIELEMIEIPAGSFMMGTDEAEIERLCQKYNTDWYKRESPQHLVTVQSFLMAKYPVTQAQWQAVTSLPIVKRELESKPSHFTGENLPVEQVSWHDAIEFCCRLSQYSKRDYYLPSEAQWEYGCRSVSIQNVGAQGLRPSPNYAHPFHFGETITSELANYDANYTFANEPEGEYREKTTPVGQFPHNAFGLYDMHGNVWEWCADTRHDNYEGAPSDGRAWVDQSIDSVFRGGSWYITPDLCRSATRNDLTCDYRYYLIGFRVVCGVGRTT